jgi:hypothetical protein
MPPGDSNSFPISSLSILENDEGFTIKCLSKYMNKTMFKDLDKVISELDVLPLDEFLSNLN